MFKPPVFNYLLLKTAARCNLACTYCYWFRDDSVYERPKVLTEAAEAALLQRLDAHVREHELEYFTILFHGGEPLLLGKRRFLVLLDALRGLEKATGCRINLSITTNGVLVDDEWAAIFNVYRVSPTISIDGRAAVHDARRVTTSGRGSHARTIAGLEAMRRHGLEPGVLAVCDPATQPDDLASYFVDELHLDHFDILAPDATHDDSPAPIAPYYKRLFDLWYDDYWQRGVDVRYVKAIMIGALGGEAHLESIGYGPIQTCTMLTDGSLEPLDVLRIAGYRATAGERSIFTHTFQDVTEDPVWREAFESAAQLAEPCQTCEWRRPCGGGFLPHRWSAERRWDNQSVYCGDLKEIFSHVSSRVMSDVTVVADGVSTPLDLALADA